MKQVVMGVVCGVMVLVTMLAVMTVEGRNSRERELEQAVSAAVDQTVEALERQHPYPLTSNEEFAADFAGLLLEQLHSGEGEDGDENLSVQVDIAGCDVKKGLLSVCVTEKFSHPNGRVGTVRCKATALLETPKPAKYHTVTYLLGDEVYASYALKDGEALKKPEDPVIPEQSFLGWMDADTHLPAVFSAACGGDKTYTAIMH